MSSNSEAKPASANPGTTNEDTIRPCAPSRAGAVGRFRSLTEFADDFGYDLDEEGEPIDDTQAPPARSASAEPEAAGAEEEQEPPAAAAA